MSPRPALRVLAAAGLAMAALATPETLRAAGPATPMLNNSHKGDRELGQYLSSECVTCHQITGRATGGVPPIVAWPEDQFIAVLNSYKTKDRDNAVMQAIAARLSDDDIEALAAYFGGLPMQPDAR